MIGREQARERINQFTKCAISITEKILDFFDKNSPKRYSAIHSGKESQFATLKLHDLFGSVLLNIGFEYSDLTSSC